MGVFDIYCGFCAGPFHNARTAWLEYVLYNEATGTQGLTYPADDGQWKNPPGFPVPTKPVEEIVTISEEDGLFFQNFVCVSPLWHGYVSPPCESHDSYGGISIDGSDDWQRQPGLPHYIAIHRGCLSILCRRTNITPRNLWESMFSPGSDYARYGGNGNGLMYCIEYYDMKGRNEQFFGYAVDMRTPSQDHPGGADHWHDVESMEDTKWLLARPTAFPVVLPLVPRTVSTQDNGTACSRALMIPEILGLILLQLVYPEPQDILAAEILTGNSTIPSSLTLATRTLFSFLSLNHYFYAAVTDRQDLFLRLAWQHGWMLPVSPLDWKAWPNGPLLNDDNRICCQPDRDWRGYLLTFLRKEDPHVRNRWRFHRMHAQFARGKTQRQQEGVLPWKWCSGELAVLNSLTPPEPWFWEIEGVQSSVIEPV